MRVISNDSEAGYFISARGHQSHNGCPSKHVETKAVTKCFHGFRGEVLWQRDVAVFEIEGHPTRTLYDRLSLTEDSPGSKC